MSQQDPLSRREPPQPSPNYSPSSKKYLQPQKDWLNQWPWSTLLSSR